MQEVRKAFGGLVVLDGAAEEREEALRTLAAQPTVATCRGLLRGAGFPADLVMRPAAEIRKALAN
jgi:hypothetical protein